MNAPRPGPHSQNRSHVRPIFLTIALALALGASVISWHGVIKPLPAGLSIETPARSADDVQFLADLTYVDPEGTCFADQTIFDEVFKIVREARERITLDLFLFNEHQGEPPERTRALCSELTELLLAQKRMYPALEILLITDPIDTVYGGPSLSHGRSLAIEAARPGNEKKSHY